MSNVVVAYPSISQTDFDWIQDLRKVHDRLYGAIEPHVTFIFPTAKLSTEDLIRHTELKSENFYKIAVNLTKAIVIEDDSKTFFHTFLIPLKGNKEVTELHDLLYTDELASELRLDIPFMPHVGIGTNADKVIMQKLADTINTSGKSINGSIDELTVASYDGNRVKNVKHIRLK